MHVHVEVGVCVHACACRGVCLCCVYLCCVCVCVVCVCVVCVFVLWVCILEQNITIVHQFYTYKAPEPVN